MQPAPSATRDECTRRAPAVRPAHARAWPRPPHPTPTLRDRAPTLAAAPSQERYVYLTDNEIGVQKLTKDRQVIPLSTKHIYFADIVEVTGELDTCVLMVKWRHFIQGVHRLSSKGRPKTTRFLLPNAEMVERWAMSVQRLVRLAGYNCLATIESPGSAADAELEEWMNDMNHRCLRPDPARPPSRRAARLSPSRRLPARVTQAVRRGNPWHGHHADRPQKHRLSRF